MIADKPPSGVVSGTVERMSKTVDLGNPELYINRELAALESLETGLGFLSRSLASR